ncbi:MAG: hypothetical protein JW984_15680 [Deltaproteobacteria bacterium]|uniref:Uncharacterized protein n=1 Tax=Candidatus Zymogenus saltonus TaxID=2844893 RepID=A0A9D8PS94_9DELT|nr:hypothetical protein [Candidatus Zymogenus saltonus]
MRVKITKDIAKFVSPQSPRNVRLMAANGAIPLPPADLIKILYILCFDRDTEVKKRAQGNFKEFSTDIIVELINKDIEPGVIDFLVRYHKDRNKLIKGAILNKNTPDDTIAYLARAKSTAIAEMISQNHERIFRSDKIFNALMGNPMLSVATKERLRELRDRSEAAFGQSDDSEVVVMGVVDSDGGGAGGAEVGTGYGGAGRVAVPVSSAGVDKAKTSSEEEEETGNAAKRIMKMNVSQKIKLATIAEKEERTILLRDSSKIVVAATIKSPKITEEEILNVAKSKQASDEAIRLITLNKEWMKTYSIKLALVNNPKTPPSVAMRLMNTLSKKDIRDISNSRNVSSLISNNAKKILYAREKRS